MGGLRPPGWAGPNFLRSIAIHVEVDRARTEDEHEGEAVSKCLHHVAIREDREDDALAAMAPVCASSLSARKWRGRRGSNHGARRWRTTRQQPWRQHTTSDRYISVGSTPSAPDFEPALMRKDVRKTLSMLVSFMQPRLSSCMLIYFACVVIGCPAGLQRRQERPMHIQTAAGNNTLAVGCCVAGPAGERHEGHWSATLPSSCSSQGLPLHIPSHLLGRAPPPLLICSASPVDPPRASVAGLAWPALSRCRATSSGRPPLSSCTRRRASCSQQLINGTGSSSELTRLVHISYISTFPVPISGINSSVHSLHI